jgi:rubrerythrin
MAGGKEHLIVEHAAQLWQPSTRRSFLRMLGIGGSVVLLPGVFAACSDDTTGIGTGGGTPVTLNLATDFGILNYAYALEQLEAAFYSAVVASTPFASMTAEQKEVFTDLRNHEVIHREFFKAALGTNAIGSLALSDAAVASTLTSTAVILRNAEAFEDLGVAAYNGAGKYLQSADFLTIAGKIVSVEARHAAAIRDMRDAAGGTTGAATGTRFAGDDVVQPLGGTYQGLDVKLEPSAVLARVGATGLVTTAITVSAPTAKQGTPDAGPPSPTP